MKRILLVCATAILAGAWVGTADAGSGIGPSTAEANVIPRHADAVAPAPRIERNGKRIAVHIESDVDADVATVASTLTDYDHLADFIPNMSSSRTISRAGQEAVVKQEGIATFGPFRQSFSVVLDAKETLPSSITLTGVGGDFKYFAGKYEILALAAHRSRIVYDAEFIPDLPLPDVLTMQVMRSLVGSQFAALVREAERRGAGAAQGPPEPPSS